MAGSSNVVTLYSHFGEVLQSDGEMTPKPAEIIKLPLLIPAFPVKGGEALATFNFLNLIPCGGENPGRS
jgi:hypothetical protein